MSNTGVVDIEKYATQANPRETLLIRFVARALLNASLKSSEDVLTLLEGGEKAALMQVLIDERNKRILDYIAAHPKENIVIVYGALHFNGVFEALQNGSSSWKIDALQTQFPYKN
jgi:pheromone shutdown protein TraB